MKKSLRVLLITAMILAISAVSLFAFAASTNKRPADILAGLTNKSVEEIIQERSVNGKTLGVQAEEADVLEAFRAERFEMQKSRVQEKLQERVAAGKMTQEQADALMTRAQEHMQNCTGDRTLGQKLQMALHQNGSENGFQGFQHNQLGQDGQKGMMQRGAGR